MPPRAYLDHAATTPPLPAARDAMAAGLARWHNPGSPHAEGRAARAALEEARRDIADALGWDGRIVFTSGASEALALALGRHRRARTFVSAVEHDAVLRAARAPVCLPVDGAGIVAVDDLPPDALVAVQHANNETGVLQPVADIAARVRAAGGTFLCDCAQTAGKLPLPDADMVAISAHKFGGPPGIGALLLRDYDLIEASGGQEQGYRGGTENVPAILAMAAALAQGAAWMAEAATLRARLEAAITVAGGAIVAGATPRIATIGACRMPGVPAAAQLIHFDMAGIAVSAGSACASGSMKPSRVLRAMGISAEAAEEVVRVSFGPATTAAEVDRFAAAWVDLAARRRAR